MEAILISVIITALIFAFLLAAARITSSPPQQTQRMRRKNYVKNINREQDVEVDEDTENKEGGSKLRQMLRKASKG